jgi:hypothetical protein
MTTAHTTLTRDQVVAWLEQVRDFDGSTPEAREFTAAALQLLVRLPDARERLRWKVVDHSIIDTGLVQFRLESHVMADGLVEAHNGVLSGLLGVGHD